MPESARMASILHPYPLNLENKTQYNVCLVVEKNTKVLHSSLLHKKTPQAGASGVGSCVMVRCFTCVVVVSKV